MNLLQAIDMSIAETLDENRHSMKYLPTFATTARTDLSALENRVLCCDALDLLRTLPDASIDMVLADLPYGTLSHIGWDKIINLDIMWIELQRILKPRCVVVLTASQPFTSILVTSQLSWFRHEWIWKKSQGTGYLNANRQPMKNHESIIVFSDGTHNYYPQMREGKAYCATSGTVGGFVRDKSVGGYLTINDGSRYPLTVIDFNSEQNTIHPTQKPVALFEYLIKTYTQAGETVLDMTCGSGTTGVAAQKTGRKYILGDNGRDDRAGRYWADIARERIQTVDPYQDTELANGNKQLSLFADLA